MSQKPTVERSCERCAAAFLAQPRDVERGKGRFCSLRCAGAAGGTKTNTEHPQQGEGNFNFKGWASKRPVVYTTRSKKRYPERDVARLKVREAIKRGKLTRPTHCEESDQHPGPIFAHHENYRFPLRVRWLCRPCHRLADTRLQERRRIAHGRVRHTG